VIHLPQPHQLIVALQAVVVVAVPSVNRRKTVLDTKYPRLQNLIMAAGLRTDLSERLLNGQRQQVAVEFGLSALEIETVMKVQAKTMRDFAQGLLELCSHQSRLNAVY
jgi:hypothetical protein